MTRIGIDGRKIADFGIGTYIRELLAALAQLDGPERYVVFAPEPAGELIPGSMEHVPFDAPHYSATELLTLGHAVDSAHLDLFHAPHYVVPITRCPVVVTVHDLIHLHQPHVGRASKLYARMMIGRALRKARRVLTVSQAVRSQILDSFAIAPEKIVVTPNGVSDRFRPAARTTGNYILYVGNDKPHKNVKALVEATELAALPEATLMLVGAAFLRFREHPLVVSRGFVDDALMPALYRDALVLVQPSHEEGFGLTALEAMACGTPVITSMAAALLEVTGDAALHVDARSPAVIAGALRSIEESSDLRASLSTRGVERARTFTWIECAQRTREAYRLL